MNLRKVGIKYLPESRALINEICPAGTGKPTLYLSQHHHVPRQYTAKFSAGVTIRGKLSVGPAPCRIGLHPPTPADALSVGQAPRDVTVHAGEGKQVSCQCNSTSGPRRQLPRRLLRAAPLPVTWPGHAPGYIAAPTAATVPDTSILVLLPLQLLIMILLLLLLLLLLDVF